MTKDILAWLRGILTELRRISSPEGILINRAQTTVTVGTPTRPDVDQIANAATGTPGYDTVPVFDDVHRLANRLWIVCDGPGTLFAIVSPNGTDWCGEGEIFPNEFRVFTGVWELRVRSPNAACAYRVSEFEIGKLV